MLDVTSKDYVFGFDSEPFIIPEPNILTVRTERFALFPNLWRAFESRLASGGGLVWSGGHVLFQPGFPSPACPVEKTKSVLLALCGCPFCKCLCSSFVSPAFPLSLLLGEGEGHWGCETRLAELRLRPDLGLCLPFVCSCARVGVRRVPSSLRGGHSPLAGAGLQRCGWLSALVPLRPSALPPVASAHPRRVASSAAASHLLF